MHRSHICQSAQMHLKVIRRLHQRFIDAYARADLTKEFSDREYAREVKLALESAMSAIDSKNNYLPVPRLSKGLFARVPSFVDRVRVRELDKLLEIVTLTLGGSSSIELYNKVVRRRVTVPPSAKSIMLSDTFMHSLKPNIEHQGRFIFLSAYDIAGRGDAELPEIIAQAESLGLKLCVPEAAVQYCLQTERYGYPAEHIKVMSSPTTDIVGPDAFDIHTQDGFGGVMLEGAVHSEYSKSFGGVFMFQLPEES